MFGNKNSESKNIEMREEKIINYKIDLSINV